MSYSSHRTQIKYTLSGSFQCLPVGGFLSELPQYPALGFLGDMKYSYASQLNEGLFKDRVWISSIFASPMPSSGFGTFETIGRLFTGALEKDIKYMNGKKT